MVNSYDLNSMKDVSLDNCVLDELVDIREIQKNNDVPFEVRFDKTLNDVKNPYLFKVGDTAVKIKFNNDGDSLSKSLTRIAAQM